MAKEKLFNEFSPVSPKEWKQKIQVDLKGADYNEALVWESPEGIKVKPFYTQEDVMGTQEGLEARPQEWKALFRVGNIGEEMVREKVQWAWDRGAEGFFFSTSQNGTSLQTILQGLPLEKTSVFLDGGLPSFDELSALNKTLGAKTLEVFYRIDPIGHLARTGNWYRNMETDMGAVHKALSLNSAHLIGADGSLYANAGATIAQQLAYVLAHAQEYVHHCDENGDLANLKGITFTMAMGGNYFFEIAKLRALRWLWSSVCNVYGVNIPCHILAVPGTRNKTLYGYNVNLLRTATECMSAVIGGADSIMNLPYDAIYHKTNAFADRLALNQLMLLKHEAHLDKVGNVADGAYYIESLTRHLAEKALGLFKEIEASGGFLKQLKSHKIQKKIKESANKQRERYEGKKEILVGSNAFKNDADRMKNEIERFPFLKKHPRKTLIAPILEQRLAEADEKERMDHE